MWYEILGTWVFLMSGVLFVVSPFISGAKLYRMLAPRRKDDRDAS